ncbi:helix-turn-helix domain-containing protein [Amycolatopsis sp. NPDC059021]|uniref:helix-turn-helix domain-containing protein n=1 Tax=Amycolatopsis sp. NPDC059021 TaxID=3346704 RepID=UPI003670920F
MDVGEIAVMFAATAGYVREVVHAFNTSGFAALSPKLKGGRPRRFGSVARDQICRIAAWSLTTLDGSDYPSHVAQEAAIAGYLRWRNRRCHPKRHFAVNSKIRRPDYLPNVA